MQARYLPPTRRSILDTGAVKTFGPHQRLNSSGFVHAFHTRSRGASNTRVSTSSLPSVFPFACFSFLVGMTFPPTFFRFRFPLSLGQMGGEAAQAILPEDSVTGEPTERRAQRCRIDLAAAHAALRLDVDQAGVLEHAEMSRDRGQAHSVRRRELAHGGGAPGELLEDGPSNRVSQRGEDRVEVRRDRRSVNHLVK